MEKYWGILSIALKLENGQKSRKVPVRIAREKWLRPGPGSPLRMLWGNPGLCSMSPTPWPWACAALAAAASAAAWELAMLQSCFLSQALCDTGFWVRVLSGCLSKASWGSEYQGFLALRKETGSPSHQYSPGGKIIKPKCRKRDRSKCWASKQKKLKQTNGFFYTD